MPKVFYSNSHDSDAFYAVRTRIPDPFFFFDIEKKGKYVFLDHREFGVFKEHNKNIEIQPVLLNPLLKKAAQIPGTEALQNKLALYLFQQYGLDTQEIYVPRTFPLDMADFLRSHGIVITPLYPFFPERLIKTPEEVKAIRESLLKTQEAFRYIENVLRRARVRQDNILIYEGTPLTSERLKHEVERLLLEQGMVCAEGIIISCGSDAAIPHHQGHGFLRAHETIVCDIFPVNRATGYFADMTRTYAKGEPSLEKQKLYEAVLASQEAGIAAVKPGVLGKEIHEVCSQVFVERGYEVADDRGFTHGTGHGLGLDIHEEPYANASSEAVLVTGNVITVEPGLYYSKLGGVRIEDVVHITEQGAENLTQYPKELIIP